MSFLEGRKFRLCRLARLVRFVSQLDIYSCKVCMQTSIYTTSEVKCREHSEAKLPKSYIYVCFPHLESKH
ncbi:hypothetical protein MKW92_010114 [Papaver armeniacum]|nr:hypothetical protein MKW92_010114 [Papaver armeniacum]